MILLSCASAHTAFIGEVKALLKNSKRKLTLLSKEMNYPTPGCRVVHPLRLEAVLVVGAHEFYDDTVAAVVPQNVGAFDGS